MQRGATVTCAVRVRHAQQECATVEILVNAVLMMAIHHHTDFRRHAFVFRYRAEWYLYDYRWSSKQGREPFGKHSPFWETSACMVASVRHLFNAPGLDVHRKRL